MKSSSSSATPMFRTDAETPCDTPNNSNDVVITNQSAAASSTIPSNLQRPLKKEEADPRHKIDYVIFVTEEVYDEEPSAASQSNVSRVENDELLDLFAYYKTKYKRKRAKSVFSERKSELEKYLEDKVEPDVKKFDLLDWWKNKSHTYLIISVMAQDILAIPASTAASESAFSTGGRVLDSFRSSLTPKTV
ncbi:hypothetical protein F3Y22_tig00111095pilonHSYRG01045 [Hibiscus syriacus]|uniref:HAT C-terminal dimerisation domain-containing protein n=1 Tax=Hibiscus syriacus TaxID=106335 RepID=A0A6A2Z3S7_HIBSY|nr:hypothetical protein F3Y22_tig00111095pilonHSYRG01045 [Hibiscus syriacus]